jgi:long-subunit fatty acid transport protein
MTTRFLTCGAVAGLALAWLAAAPAAHAGAFYLVERGARSFSLSGAHIAGADDMNAQWLNPAGLTRLAGNVHLYLDFATIIADQSFARAFDAEVARRDPMYTNGFGTVENDGSPLFDPSLGFATRFGLEDWIFAFGVYGPYTGTNRWPADGPQRYANVSLDPIKLTAQLSVAWRPHPRFAIGVGLQGIFASIKQRVAISAYPGVFGAPEDRELDAFAEVTAHDSFSPSGNMGIIVTPVDGFDIGLSGQLPVRADLEGRLRVNLPTHWYFSESAVSGDRLAGNIDFPGVLRLGLRAYEPDLWSVELASVVEFWSAQKTIAVVPDGIEFTDIPGIGTFRIKPISIRQDLKDVVSVRLGGSFRPDGPAGLVTLRAGTSFETGSPPDATLSTLRIDGDKIGVSLGATFHLDPIALDFAMGWSHMFARTITDSEKRQVNPLYDESEAPFGDAGPTTVGNGTYELDNWVIALTLNAGW